MTTPEIIQTAFTDTIRAIYDFHFNALAAAETQGEKWVREVLDKAPWVDERVRKATDGWFAAARHNRLQIKGILEEHIKTVENFTAAV